MVGSASSSFADSSCDCSQKRLHSALINTGGGSCTFNCASLDTARHAAAANGFDSEAVTGRLQARHSSELAEERNEAMAKEMVLGIAGDGRDGERTRENKELATTKAPGASRELSATAN